MGNWVRNDICIAGACVPWVTCDNCMRGPLMNDSNQFVFSAYCPHCGEPMMNPGKSGKMNIISRTDKQEFPILNKVAFD